MTAGNPTLLVVSETTSSSSVGAKLFYIKDGRLEIVEGEYDSYFGFMEGAIKYIEPNLYQVFGYYNGIGGWYIHDIAIDFSTGLATLTAQHELDWEDGGEIYQRWLDEGSYYFE